MSKLRVDNSGTGRARGESFLYDYGRGEQWRSMKLRVALGFPAEYRTGMSNLGFLWVYHLLNNEDGVRCDRFFLPEGQGEHSGAVTTIETGRPLCQYDVVAFSLPYERDYAMMVWLLRRGGIEAVAEKRQCNPVVIAGGVAVSANPEPVADFLDAVVVGEAEGALPAVVDALAGGGDVLEALSRVPGVYVPAMYEVEYNADGTVSRITPDEPVRAGVLSDIETPAHSPVVSEGAAFSGMFLVEMSRGCPHRCRFCLTSYSTQGFRSAGEKRMLEVVEKGLGVSRRVGLIGTAFAQAAPADAVCGLVERSGGRVSFSSLRLTPKVKDMLARWGHIIDNETISIAPEAATDKLRKVLDKDMEKGLESFMVGGLPDGVKGLKLYYLSGVPGEDDSDIDAIAEETLSIRARAPRGMRISVSLNPMVPKAHTPMQWMKPVGRVESKSRAARLKKALGAHGVKVSGMGAREAEIQTMLSLGDRRLSSVISDVAEGGCTASGYEESLRRNGLSMDFYAGRARKRSEMLPWGVVSHASDGALWEQYERAAEYAGVAPVA